MSRATVILAAVAFAIVPSSAQVGQRPAAPAVATVADAKGLGIRWARIPAGTFQMGCVPGDEECDADEKPRHAVTLTRDYWLMTTEVTVEMFRPYASAGHPMALQPDWNANPRQPVVMVPWGAASGFCAWLGGRLPTEAEFDRAARAGVDEAKYPWGNEPLPLPNGARVANVADESAKKKYPNYMILAGYDDGFAQTAPVGSFKANAFGLHDMAGNMLEWVADLYTDHYPEGPVVNPLVTVSSSTNGLVRGGSWYRQPKYQRLSQRMGTGRNGRGWDFGFRCARNTQ